MCSNYSPKLDKPQEITVGEIVEILKRYPNNAKFAVINTNINEGTDEFVSCDYEQNTVVIRMA